MTSLHRLKIFLSRNILVLLFFGLYFLLGITIFNDYGIAWDEIYRDNSGRANLDYLFNGDITVFSESNPENYYGPIYEIFVVGLTRLINLTDPQPYFYFRHLVGFSTFFTGVIFFYLICLRRFKNKYIALLGSSFLILTPRLFSDAFYNSKDAVLLSFFTITFYAFFKFFDKKTYLRLIIFSALTAITINIRLVGVVIPFFAFFYFLSDYLRYGDKRKNFLNEIYMIICYVLITTAVLILTWPFLWPNPPAHFLIVWNRFSHYFNDVQNLYLGEYVSALRVPWHYIPVWFTITTPPFYLFLFVIGFINILSSLKKELRKNFIQGREDLTYILWFLFPIFTVITLHSSLYNAWRHLFFIYPAFLLISLHGIRYLYSLAQDRLKSRNVSIALTVLILLNIVYIAKIMVMHHPYQHLYFNILAGRDMRTVWNNFETDYWGLSYRKGLEYIVEHDKSEEIILLVDTAPGAYNSHLIPEPDRSRLKYVWSWELQDSPESTPKPKYFLTTFFNSREEPPYSEIYTVTLRRAKIMSVYEL